MYARQLQPATAEKAARLNRATLAQFGWAMLRSRGRTSSSAAGSVRWRSPRRRPGLTPSEQERLDVIGARLAGASGRSGT